MNISFSCPNTAGELFQGSIEGIPCLVSCPISIYSTAMVISSTAQLPLPLKAYNALQASGICPPPGLRLNRRLPTGRGYGTSTADIGSVLFAAAKFNAIQLDSYSASKIATRIEPTDSSLLPGLALFDHREADFYEHLGETPDINLVILDPGGRVDSQAFNRHDWSAALKKLAPIHGEALGILRQGVKEKDIALIGHASTLSAISHQSILHSPWLKTALALAKATGAAGVSRAHSGTILALIYPSSGFDKPGLSSFILRLIPKGLRLRMVKMVAGGCREKTQCPKENIKVDR